MKNTTTLNSGQIRKYNQFLKNWAKHTKSDKMYNLILDNIITTNSDNSGKVVLKG